MVLLASTSGAKNAQANWFGSHITVPFANAKRVISKINTTTTTVIAYTLDGGTTWNDVNFSGGISANTDYELVVPMVAGDQFNIRKSTSGNVTVTKCEVGIKPSYSSRFAFSENRITNSVLYYALDGNQALGGNATESKRRIPVSRDFAITRIRANIDTNGKDGATVIAFRDDGADAVTISIAAGSATEADSGALSGKLIAEGSECCFKSDTGASTNANTFSSAIVVVEVEYFDYAASTWYSQTEYP
jgi:hypothetical protein